jgi:hypothetical protein
MSQPLFGRTAGTEDAALYAQKYKLDFVELHFRGDEAKLRHGMDALGGLGIQYIPNFEGAPVATIGHEQFQEASMTTKQHKERETHLQNSIYLHLPSAA